jgi:tRNA threonylcarbamoyladenosine biosynthesis protein TsaE
MTVTVTTRSAAETMEVAARVGSLLLAGDVVLLAGELGTGKTVFAKGIARALGVDEPVVSPSFTVVREYEGALPMVHVDVYRIDRLQELHDLGFDDMLGDDAVAVVEWGDRVNALIPVDRLEVRITADEDEDDVRVLELTGRGTRWSARAEALVAAVEGVGG